MGTPRPKKFYAATDFSIGSALFSAGDEVTGVALRAVLPHGDRFVTSKPLKRTTTNGEED